MNIGRMKLDDAFLIFITLIATGILQMLGISLDTTRTVLTYVVVIFLIFYKVGNPIILGNKTTVSYLFIYFIVICYAILRSILIYKFNTSDVLYAMRQYLWIILAIPIVEMLIRNKNQRYILTCILYPYLFMLGIRFITSIFFNVFHIKIFNGILQEYGSLWLRNTSFARIDTTGLMFIALVIAYYLFYLTNEYKFLLSVIFILISNIIISQTRSVTLSSIFCVMTMIFFSKKRNTNTLFVLITFLVLVLGFVFYYQYFNILNADVLKYRYYEYQYFLDLIQQHFFNGFGILSLRNPNSSFVLTGNWSTPMYLDDLGIMGSTVQFGLIGTLLLYGGLIVSLFNNLFKAIKLESIGISVLLSGLLSYIIFSCLLLDLFSIQRIIAVPFVIALTGWASTILGAEENDKSRNTSKK